MSNTRKAERTPDVTIDINSFSFDELEVFEAETGTDLLELSQTDEFKLTTKQIAVMAWLVDRRAMPLLELAEWRRTHKLGDFTAGRIKIVAEDANPTDDAS